MRKLFSLFLPLLVVGFMAVGAVGVRAQDTNLTIAENGRNSDNTIAVSSEQTTVVEQQNHVIQGNFIAVDSSSGGIEVKDNHGDTNVNTGANTTTVAVTNAAGGNLAMVEPCGCEPGDLNVSVVENGRNSDNTVAASSTQTTAFIQDNHVAQLNAVVTLSRSGGIKVKDNHGDTRVRTGANSTTVRVRNYAGLNVVAQGGLLLPL